MMKFIIFSPKQENDPSQSEKPRLGNWHNLLPLLPSGAVELVPHLPPCLGLWRHPHPHACHQDGRPLQAWLRPTQRLPGPASACLVPDGHAAQTGLLPDTLCQAGEAGGCKAVICVHTTVDHVTGGAGGAGAEYFPWEERGLNLNMNHDTIIAGDRFVLVRP